MKVVVFADGPQEHLAPLTEETCCALLPVVNKPLLHHLLEALGRIEGEEALSVSVVGFAHVDKLRSFLGRGERWGMSIEIVLRRRQEDREAVLARICPSGSQEVLVLSSDVLLAAELGDFVGQARASGSDSVAATQDGVSTGMFYLTAFGGDKPGESLTHATMVELQGAYFSPLESLSQYLDVNLMAARGEIPHLLVPGREVGVGVTVGRRTRIPLQAVHQVPAVLGDNVRISTTAELLGSVVVSDDVVVDAGAVLENCVVLPGTYVGELTALADAIAWKDILVHPYEGRWVRVPDAFLLADLYNGVVRHTLGGALHRGGALFLLLLSLPLWPLMLVASFLADSKAPLRSVRLVGNRVRLGLGGAQERGDFVAMEAATSIPLLRSLPKLLAVIAGHIRLVGVAPISPEEHAARQEVWELARDDAPVGLLGPTQLVLGRSAPREQRLMSDAFFAQDESPWREVRWLARGFLSLFTPRAWAPAKTAS